MFRVGSMTLAGSYRSPTPTKSLEGPPPNGDIAELRTTSDGESKAIFLAFDELVLRKLDELLEEVGDAKERLRLISKAIEHLQEMREKLSAAG